jgi:hypothetical protein
MNATTPIDNEKAQALGFRDASHSEAHAKWLQDTGSDEYRLWLSRIRPRPRQAALARVRQLAKRHNYVADGNHLFTLRDYLAIQTGAWRASVIEHPHRHRASIVRLARALANLY